MQTASKFYGNITVQDEAALSWVRVVMQNTDDRADLKSDTQLWSCHEVCIALRALLPQLQSYTIVHGALFGRQHAWLQREMGFERIILDPLPIAVASGPILLEAATMTPWYKGYNPLGHSDAYTAERLAKFHAGAKEFLQHGGSYREGVNHIIDQLHQAELFRRTKRVAPYSFDQSSH